MRNVVTLYARAESSPVRYRLRRGGCRRGSGGLHQRAARGRTVLRPEIFKPLQAFLSMSNCAVTRCEYRAGQWKLITWNDHTHLR
jgi:hypothetical protein